MFLEAKTPQAMAHGHLISEASMLTKEGPSSGSGVQSSVDPWLLRKVAQRTNQSVNKIITTQHTTVKSKLGFQYLPTPRDIWANSHAALASAMASSNVYFFKSLSLSWQKNTKSV